MRNCYPSTIEFQRIQYGHPKYVALSTDAIIGVVSNYYDITINKMQSKSREQPIARARMIAMYFIYKCIRNASLKSIGKLFNRDHTTVIHAKNTVHDMTFGPDPVWRDEVLHFYELFNL